MATTDAYFASISGDDAAIVLKDANGNLYRLLTDSTNGGLNVTKNGVSVGLTGLRNISAKTANYSVVAADLGTTFTTRGASGAVNFTLPATSTISAGWWARFFNVADQDIIVTAATADTMVVFNDPTADSIAFSTTGEQVGSGVEVVWDGTGWLTFVFLGAETVTPTIVTA